MRNLIIEENCHFTENTDEILQSLKDVPHILKQVDEEKHFLLQEMKEFNEISKRNHSKYQNKEKYYNNLPKKKMKSFNYSTSTMVLIIKNFNNSAPMMILTTAASLSVLTVLFLGSLEVLSDRLSINERTLKNIKGVVTLSVFSLLTVTGIAVGCNQLWVKFACNNQILENKPPDT